MFIDAMSYNPKTLLKGHVLSDLRRNLDTREHGSYNSLERKP